MSGSYRWTYGTMGAAALTTTYEVATFSRQADQPDVVDWLLELDDSDVYVENAETVDALDGNRAGFGDGTFTLVSGYLSPGMLQYLRSTLFRGALSAPATVMLRDRGSLTMGWKTVRCLAHWPDIQREATPQGDGYSHVKFTFTKARIAGRGFSRAFSNSFG